MTPEQRNELARIRMKLSEVPQTLRNIVEWAEGVDNWSKDAPEVEEVRKVIAWIEGELA